MLGKKRTLTWDSESRLSAVADNGHTTRYTYDHAGRRVIKRGVGGETAWVNNMWTVRNRAIGTKHVFVGNNRAVSKVSSGTASINGLVTDGCEPDETSLEPPDPTLTVPCSVESEWNFLYFYHPDHLGSVSWITDADGEVYEHIQYFPGGEMWVHEHGEDDRAPYRFSGKEFEEELGLYDFGARYYDPRTMLWLSPDPAMPEYLNGESGMGGVFNPRNLNTYHYAGHNPIRLLDPDGRKVEIFGTKRFVRRVVRALRKLTRDSVYARETQPGVFVVEIKSTGEKARMSRNKPEGTRLVRNLVSDPQKLVQIRHTDDPVAGHEDTVRLKDGGPKAGTTAVVRTDSPMLDSDGNPTWRYSEGRQFKEGKGANSIVYLNPNVNQASRKENFALKGKPGELNYQDQLSVAELLLHELIHAEAFQTGTATKSEVDDERDTRGRTDKIMQKEGGFARRQVEYESTDPAAGR